MSTLSFITARKTYLSGGKKLQVKFEQIYYVRGKEMHNLINKKPINYPPAYPVILQNHSIERFEVYTSSNISRNTYLHFFLSSVFGGAPSIQDVKEIYNVLDFVNSKSWEYVVGLYMRPIYIASKNPVVASSETIHVGFERNYGPFRYGYYFRNPFMVTNEQEEIRRDIDQAVEDNYIIIYLDTGYIQCRCLRKTNLDHVYVDSKGLRIEIKYTFKHFNKMETEYYGLSKHFDVHNPEIADTLFFLMVMSILQNHSPRLYSNLIFKQELNLMKLVPETEIEECVLSPVFIFYNSYTNKVMDFFILTISIKRIARENYEYQSDITLIIYFIGATRTLHHCITRLRKEILLHSVKEFLLGDKFITTSNRNDFKHYMFFEVRDFEVKPYAFMQQQK